MAEPTATITVRVPKSTKDELAVLAKSTGRNRNVLVQEAIRRFIEAEKSQIALIEERIREADAGNFATDEEMEELWAEFRVNRAERVAR